MTKQGLLGGIALFVLIASFITFNYETNNTQAKAQDEPPTSTLIEENSEEEFDLGNACNDIGLDADLAAAVEVEKESEFDVNDPIGNEPNPNVAPQPSGG